MSWGLVLIPAVLVALLAFPAAPASGYDVVTVSNGGTIRGRVTFTGPPQHRVEFTPLSLEGIHRPLLPS